MIRINELKLKPDHSTSDLEREIRKLLRLKNEDFSYEIMRQSLDARKKPNLFYSYTIDVKIPQETSVLRKARTKKAVLFHQKEYSFPCSDPGSRSSDLPRPVIAGSGPAGLFCGLMLARAGLRPVILERGECVEKRTKTVEHFWKTGELDPESNVQFGEGGAGTFSDGKLNTLIKDPEGRIRFVLKNFVQAGAKEEILYLQKPHIGTDVLTEIVKNIRLEIEQLGGEFRFENKLIGIGQLENGQLRLWIQEKTANETYCLDTAAAVLAIGHSARDTFRMLAEQNLPMQAKSFAIGLRMEHPQVIINDAMYGKDCPYELEAAPYKVTHKCENGRGVYSFCMCPGGYVVNASSELGRLAVNGMSYSDRGSTNANSAIVVTVTPEDYGAQSDDPLAGLAFQEKLEEAAYQCGNGKIPVQKYGDFKENHPTGTPGKVQPQMKGAFELSNLRNIFPDELNLSLIEGIEAFGKRIPGFSDNDALLSGVESRTSSPVRILRDETCQTSIPGLFPCGEGAGYAGGITSAAVDGIRVAEAVAALYV